MIIKYRESAGVITLINTDKVEFIYLMETDENQYSINITVAQNTELEIINYENIEDRDLAFKKICNGFKQNESFIDLT